MKNIFCVLTALEPEKFKTKVPVSHILTLLSHCGRKMGMERVGEIEEGIPLSPLLPHPDNSAVHS